VNLKDGGTKGLSCKTTHEWVGRIPSDRGSGIHVEETVCDWDKIPASERTSNAPITSQTFPSKI